MQALRKFIKDIRTRLEPSKPTENGLADSSQPAAEGAPPAGKKPARPQFGAGTKFLVLLFLAGILFAAVRTGTPPPAPEMPRETAVFDATARGFGAFSSEEERYNYLVQKTEGDYMVLRRRLEEQSDINKNLLLTLEEIKASNKLLETKMGLIEKDIEKNIGKAISGIEEKIKAVITAPGDTDWRIPAPGRLRIIEVPPTAEIDVAPDKRKYVYLPAGSFVKATLLTGAYAPVDRGNPLPVLISIDEGFHGPSMSRIPLKGMLAIGKAIADVNSERSVIQIVDLSWVGPDGQVFEATGNLGWVAGEDGTLGIPGSLVRRTGKVLTGAFASGFLSGAAEALSFAETEPERRGRVVTGDAGRFAGYAGLSSAAATMSKHYADLLDQIVSAVQISMGESCYVIMSRGVEIEGLTPDMAVAGPFSGGD